MSKYTAISFAPVQSFIEKSRKLRDLYGASLILSYLSQKIIEDIHHLPDLQVISPALIKDIHHLPDLQVISPALINVQEGIPNRILVKGFIDRDRVKNSLLKHWQHLLKVCREWVERNVPADYYWAQAEEQIGKDKGEWERWGSYTWEVFWGTGDNPQAAMADLENRKLKRDWIGINWIGESSSLSGTDAIAWNRLGREHAQPGRSLSDDERRELERFYLRLAWILDDLRRTKAPFPSDEELKQHFETEDGGKFITHRERLNIPELAKRLVTLPRLARKIGLEELDEGFKDIFRETGYWTGWFMGDGDKVGDKLKKLADRHPDDPDQRDKDLHRFTELMRTWGSQFKGQSGLFPHGKGRVVYAGGDDFLGVLYSEEPQHQEKPEKVKPIEAWNWLLNLPNQWKTLQSDLKQAFDIDFTYSVGFVWAAHQVPQRDILQHCREAEKQAKSLGRDRVTIRVVFNSGQYVQWTCPWAYLQILSRYQDRLGGQNWTHLYNDWAYLKSRHAIRLREVDVEQNPIDRDLALAMLDLYFDDLGQEIQKNRQWTTLAGDNSDAAVVQWINDLVQVGWQLCSNT